MSSRDSVFQAVLNNELSYEDYKSCLYCRRILGGFPDISLNHRGINLLNENLSSYRVDQDSLLTNLGEFYSYFNTEIDIAINEVIMDYSDNRYYFKNNMTWFEDYQNNIYNEEFAKYAVDSQDYRNRVASFYALFYGSYLAHLKDYKVRALGIIDEIERVIQ